ncbi:MAG: TlpA disulfide reductase family protein [Pseudomonadota bacterium]
MSKIKRTTVRRRLVARKRRLAALAGFAGMAAIYGIATGADNAAVAGSLEVADAGGVATAAKPGQGKLAAFVRKAVPEPVAEFPFLDGEGNARTIRDWRGKVVLLNLWATWCWPCREEMPSLERLQKALGSDRFEVVAVSVDRTGLKGAKEFLGTIRVDALKVYADPTARAASQLRAIGMPSTLLIDVEGREIGRLIGPAEWDSPDAKALIEAALR